MWYNLHMESAKRIADLDPQDLAVVERVFGQPLLTKDGLLVLRTHEAPKRLGQETVANVPAWFKVLEGLSDEDLAEVNASIARPSTLAHPSV